MNYVSQIYCDGGALKFFPTNSFVSNGVTYCGVVKKSQSGTAFNITQRTNNTHNIGLNETQYLVPVNNSSSLPADVKALIDNNSTFISTTKNLTTLYLVSVNTGNPTQSTIDLTTIQQNIYISPGSRFYTSGTIIYLGTGSLFSFDVPSSSNSNSSSSSLILTGDVTGTGIGTIPTTLANVNSNTGTFGDATHVARITTNAKGQITAVSSVSISASGGGITDLTGDVTATGPGSSVATLKTVNSNIGTFGSGSNVPQITVNAKGLITAATVVPVTQTAITTITGDGSATGPNSAALTLATVNSNVGLFGNGTNIPQFTVNAKGLITSAANVPVSAITDIIGDGTASGPGTASLTLAAVNSNIGTFGSSSAIPQITVNAKGLITAASNISVSAGITDLTGDVIASGPGSATATLTTVNSNIGTFGASNVPQITVDAKGRITAASDGIGITSSNSGSAIVQRDGSGRINVQDVNINSITASRALVSDASKYVTASSTTATEIGYVSGVTSAIQTQFNNTVPVILPFTKNQGTICVGQKYQIINANTDDIVYSYTGSGVLKKIWLAIFNVNPATTFLYITIDGSIIFGNTLTNPVGGDGLNNIGLSLEMLFSSGAGHYPTFICNTLGSNTGSGATLGGFFSVDMPFSTSIEIHINNSANGSSLRYWHQPFIEVVPLSIVSLQPLRLYCRSFVYSSTVYNNEYPLLNVSSANGVYLKGIKYFLTGLSVNWWESRFRMYTGGTGSNTVISPATGYTDGTYRTSLPYQVGAEVTFMSSGMEDFFLSSYNFASQASYCTDEAGLLFNSAGTNGVSATSSISVYRFFGNGSDTPPYSPPNTNFLFTITSGDPTTGPPGSFTMVGQVYYYS